MQKRELTGVHNQEVYKQEQLGCKGSAKSGRLSLLSSAFICTDFFLNLHVVTPESSSHILASGISWEKTVCLFPWSASKRLIVCPLFWLGLVPIILLNQLARPVICPALVAGWGQLYLKRDWDREGAFPQEYQGTVARRWKWLLGSKTTGICYTLICIVLFNVWLMLVIPH
jgi:hypothetical protein